jgi:hypothetical protein
MTRNKFNFNTKADDDRRYQKQKQNEKMIWESYLKSLRNGNRDAHIPQVGMNPEQHPQYYWV